MAPKLARIEQLRDIPSEFDKYMKAYNKLIFNNKFLSTGLCLNNSANCFSELVFYIHIFILAMEADVKNLLLLKQNISIVFDKN